MAKVLQSGTNVKMVGTFHALCYKIIAPVCDSFGYKKISIIGVIERDQRIKTIMEEIFTKEKKTDIEKRLSAYFHTGEIYKYGDFKVFLKLYLAQMRRDGLVDYDMIEYFAKKVIVEKGITFKHVIVDEAQDTSPVEDEIINLLGAENVFIVGDVFQNIYEFRGTTIDNLLNFKSDIEIDMSTTFRCPKPIASKANEIIENSELDYPYRLKSRKNGPSISVIECENSVEATREEVIRYAKSFELRDIFILCRLNHQVDIIKEALPDYEIEDISGGNMDTTVMNQFTSILRAHANMYHDYGVTRMVTSLKLCSNDTLFLWKRKAKREKVKLLSIVKKEIPYIDNYIKIFFKDITLLEKAKEFFSMRYINSDMYRREIGFIEEYQENVGGSNDMDFVDWLLTGTMQDRLTDSNSIKVMTVHAAKGLEAGLVIIPFVRDGVFPHRRASLSSEERLMYVAVTRASTKLVLIKDGDSMFC